MVFYARFCAGIIKYLINSVAATTTSAVEGFIATGFSMTDPAKASD